MDFQSQLDAFSAKHSIKNYSVKNGYFICPVSKTNQVNLRQMPRIMLEFYSYLDIYKRVSPHVVRGVEYFMRINGLRLDRFNDRYFSIYIALLHYFLPIYKRRLSFESINPLDLDPAKLGGWFIVHDIKKMHRMLEDYLVNKKGLTRGTARKILYDNNPDTHEGIKNILVILNTLEEKFHSKHLKIDEAYFQKQLKTTLEQINGINMLAGVAGAELEKIFEREIPYIKEKMLSITRAIDAIILPFDKEPSIKSKLMRKGLKIPDFVYFDNNGLCIPLDSKFNLDYADLRQVNASNFIKAATTVGLRI